MADRYQIITGNAPDPPPRSKKKKQSEIEFLIETHDKMASIIGGEKKFRDRVKRLYLEGQISDKAYQHIAKKYRWIRQSPSRGGGGGGSCGVALGGSCGAALDNGRC